MTGVVNAFFERCGVAAKAAGRRLSGIDIAIASLRRLATTEGDARLVHARSLLETIDLSPLSLPEDTPRDDIRSVFEFAPARLSCEALLAERAYRGRVVTGVLLWALESKVEDAAKSFTAIRSALTQSKIDADFLTFLEARRRESAPVGMWIDAEGEILSADDLSGRRLIGRGPELLSHRGALRRALLDGDHYFVVGGEGVGKSGFVKRMAESALRAFAIEGDVRLSGLRLLWCSKEDLLGAGGAPSENFEKLAKAIADGVTPVIDDLDVLLSPDSPASEDAIRTLNHHLIAGRRGFVLIAQRRAAERLSLLRDLRPRLLPAPSHETTGRIAADHLSALATLGAATLAEGPEALANRACRLVRKNFAERTSLSASLWLIDTAIGDARERAGGDVPAFDAGAMLASVSDVLNIPREMVEPEPEALTAMLEERLSSHVIAQDLAVRIVAREVGFGERVSTGRTPLARLLFAGPPGVGKTHLARTLAEALGYDQEAFVVLNMSEYATDGARTRFIGADPGYVGFGGTRTIYDVVRARPSCVILLDEIDRAHPSIQDILLSILEGEGADASGRPVYFSNAIILATTNLGQEQIEEIWRSAQARGQTRVEAASRLEDRTLRDLILTGAIDETERAMQKTLDARVRDLRDAFANAPPERREQVIDAYISLSGSRNSLELTRRHSPLDRAFLDRIDRVIPFLPISGQKDICAIVDLNLRQVGWAKCPDPVRDGIVLEVTRVGSVRMIQRLVREAYMADLRGEEPSVDETDIQYGSEQ